MSADEAGWVLEDSTSSPSAPQYWTGGAWSLDHMLAIRFARKIDAERTARGMGWRRSSVRVCEHVWTG